jgi:hypothetical protein
LNLLNWKFISIRKNQYRPVYLRQDTFYDSIITDKFIKLLVKTGSKETIEVLFSRLMVYLKFSFSVFPCLFIWLIVPLLEVMYKSRIRYLRNIPTFFPIFVPDHKTHLVALRWFISKINKVENVEEGILNQIYRSLVNLVCIRKSRLLRRRGAYYSFFWRQRHLLHYRW